MAHYSRYLPPSVSSAQTFWYTGLGDCSARGACTHAPVSTARSLNVVAACHREALPK